MSEQFVAMVLARGGSKGIPQKNIKLMNGKPLLAYTLEVAKKSQYIQRTLLSTDDPAIAEVGTAYGAEVPFLRPAELATDQASSVDVLIHLLGWLEEHGGIPEYLILLQPTSPLRTVEDLDGAIHKLLTLQGDSLVSVCEADQHPFWLKRIVDERVVPFMETKQQINRRQDLPPVYMLNGAIYIARSSLFLTNRSFYVDHTVPYIMPKDRSVDIDDKLDWLLAEALLRERT